MIEYENWLKNPTSQNMNLILKKLNPIITAEIYRYSGPKTILRSKAKLLAINAIKNYDPKSGAKLQSWVVTNLQPLSRYSQQLRPIKAPEMAIRQAAEINRVEKELAQKLGRDPTDIELADEIGISVKRIKDIKNKVYSTFAEGTIDVADSESSNSLPVVDKTNPVSFAEEAFYESADPKDKFIFDAKTGKHGVKVLSNEEIAKKLNVSPSFVSQKTREMAKKIQELSEGY